MNEKADKVLKEIEELAFIEKPRTIGRPSARPGRVFLPIIGPIKGKLLEEAIKKINPGMVLEIGCLVGYSAILMAKNMKKGKIISLEFDSKAAEIAKENIEKAGLSSKVEIIIGDARDIIKDLTQAFDLIFVDAQKNEYFTYIKLAEKNMRKGTVVFADNAKVHAEFMKDYLDYVRNSGKYKSEFHDCGSDGVEISVRL